MSEAFPFSWYGYAREICLPNGVATFGRQRADLMKKHAVVNIRENGSADLLTAVNHYRPSAIVSSTGKPASREPRC